MAGSDGSGNVPNRQIARQMAVLNKTFGGGESNEAAETAFTFTLEGIDRFFNDTWHTDHQSNFYRTQTRQGGADALNIWLVDFKYLGIAVFPWDYEQHGGIDGIRVHFDSLPGGRSQTSTSVRPPLTRSATGWGSTTRSKAAAKSPTTKSPTRLPKAAPPAAARWDATRASCQVSTRSTTTWTTASTSVTRSSRPASRRGCHPCSPPTGPASPSPRPAQVRSVGPTCAPTTPLVFLSTFAHRICECEIRTHVE